MPDILTYQGLDLSAVDYDEWSNPPSRGLVAYDGTNIVAQVVVDEDHSDDLIITEHPVEQGALINDHAFKRPAELRVRMGWSNAWAYDHAVYDVRTIYEQILTLQATRLPFTVWTGKRQYSNMLISSLRTHTDEKMAFSFVAEIEFKEIVLVSTQVIVGAATYDQGNLADPRSNAETTQRGPAQATHAVVPDNSLPPEESAGFGGAPA